MGSLELPRVPTNNGQNDRKEPSPSDGMPVNDNEVVFVDRHYGKNFVKLLHVKRQGNLHHVKELEVNTAIQLDNVKDYIKGDNSDIVATDTQKNTVYILAKKLGITSIEEFAMALSDHFLSQYKQVIEARIYIKESPWARVTDGKKTHMHAFTTDNCGTRFCQVDQKKHGEPHVSSGINDLKVLKTTQSAFVNFHKDEYRSLPDMEDRIFCTIVEAKWDYENLRGLNFDHAWETVRTTILEEFAGPVDTGVYSPSVQKTLYDTQKSALGKIPQMDSIEITLPNVHAYEFDFSKFPAHGFNKNGEVFQPTDKPSGNIYAKIQRKYQAKL